MSSFHPSTCVVHRRYINGDFLCRGEHSDCGWAEEKEQPNSNQADGFYSHSKYKEVIKVTPTGANR